jgi:PST family polysaccharide transporter
MFKRIIKNTTTYVFMGFLSQVIFFVFWFILGRWLSSSQIGMYALVMFVLDLFTTINVFALDTTITRFYYKEKSKDEVLSNILIFFAASSIITSAIFIILTIYASYLLGNISGLLNSNIIFFSLLIISNALINIILANYSALRESLFYGKMQILKTLLFTIFSLILIYIHKDILSVFFAMFLSNSTIFLLFLIKEKNRIKLNNFSKILLKEVLFYSFPLMLYGILGILYMYLGRIILDHFSSLDTLGVYSFFLVIALQFNGLLSGFNRAWAPEIFSSLEGEKEKTLKNVTSMTFLFAFLYIIFYVITVLIGWSFLFKIIFRDIYFSNLNILYVLMLAPLFTGIYTVTYPLYYYKNKTKIILLINIITLLINLPLLIFMISRWSAIGAAITFLLINIFDTWLYIMFFKKYVEMPKKIVILYCALSVLIISDILLFIFFNSILLLIIPLVIAVPFIYKIGGLELYFMRFLNLYKNHAG